MLSEGTYFYVCEEEYAKPDAAEMLLPAIISWFWRYASQYAMLTFRRQLVNDLDVVKIHQNALISRFFGVSQNWRESKWKKAPRTDVRGSFYVHIYAALPLNPENR